MMVGRVGAEIVIGDDSLVGVWAGMDHAGVAIELY